jgi:hypothetical protein
MIDEPGHPAGHLAIPPMNQETSMLKTLSAALLAASMLAAPALAASSTDQAPAAKTDAAPVAKIAPMKSSTLNTSTKATRHHRKHVAHLRTHKHVTAVKTHKLSKVSKASIKHVAPTTKRG